MEPVREQIETCERWLRTAMLRADTELLGELIADDLIFVTLFGGIATKETDIGAYKAGFQMHQIEFLEQTVRPLDTSAVTVTRAYVRGISGGEEFEDELWYTRVWQNREGSWQITAGHCSRADTLA